MESEAESESELQKQQELDDEHQLQEQTAIAKKIAEGMINRGATNAANNNNSGKAKSKRGRAKSPPASTSKTTSTTPSPTKGSPPKSARKALRFDATSGGRGHENYSEQEIQASFGFGDADPLAPEPDLLQAQDHAQQNSRQIVAETYRAKVQAFNNQKSRMTNDGTEDDHSPPRKTNSSQGGSSEGE